MKYTFSVVLACLLAFSAHAEAAAAGAGNCEARSLGFADKAVGWTHKPLSMLKRDTVYALVQEDGRAVLRGSADGSASLYLTRIKQPATMPGAVSWKWKTDAPIAGADNRDKRREDAPLRVILAFDGDRSSLPEEERRLLKRAGLPFATLMYIWSEQVAVESIIPSAHTSRVKMLVVASGQDALGHWQSVRRNIADDYRRAYGTAPGRVLAVGVMTDTDNTGEKAVGLYADIRFECVM